MDISSQIGPELWAEISDSYQSGNFTGAITEAMSLITEMLRDKSGLDGDGVELVGKALGFGKGNPPKIRVNKLQTETDRNIQEGLVLVLKGMYKMVRNPRSHERLDDSRETANAIILFIDYLLSLLGESQQSFTTQGFIESVTDIFFVLDEEYAHGIVDRIPVQKRVDALVALYNEKLSGDIRNISMVVQDILARLPEDDKQDFLRIVSEDLQGMSSSVTIDRAVRAIPAEYWPNIDKLARMRSEGILMNVFYNSFFDPDEGYGVDSYVSCLNKISMHLSRKERFKQIILKKLRDDEFREHNFIGEYFIDNLPNIFEKDQEIGECVDAISTTLERGNVFMKNKTVRFLETHAPKEWKSRFVERLKDLTDPDNPEIYFEDGTPFLGKFVPAEKPAAPEEDEIPF